MHHLPKYYLWKSAFIALFFTFAGTGSIGAQFREQKESAPTSRPTVSLTEFNFFSDRIPSSDIPIPGLQLQPVITSHKSPFLAGVLSFILPGLGEYYVGDHIWRGVIFTAVDAFLIYEHYHFISRYNDSLNNFYNYGYANWSPVIFADSLNGKLAFSGRTPFRIDTNTVKKHDFSDINKAIDTLDILGFPDMTHHLPDYSSYDYQEVISKYNEFNIGWIDYFAGGPVYSPRFEQHAIMEANTNHQGDLAAYFLWGMFVNRVLSVIDAVLLAHDHNTPIHLEGELRQYQYPGGMFGFIPTAKIRYSF